MRIIKAKDYAEMSRKAANIIAAQVVAKPNCVLGLETGGTPVGTYKSLIEDWYKVAIWTSPKSPPLTWTSTAACPESTIRATGTSCTKICSTT